MQVEIGDFVKVKQMLDEATVSAVLTLGVSRNEETGLYTYGKQRASCHDEGPAPCVPRPRRAPLPAARHRAVPRRAAPH